jgi:hypothetical protein
MFFAYLKEKEENIEAEKEKQISLSSTPELRSVLGG